MSETIEALLPGAADWPTGGVDPLATGKHGHVGAPHSRVDGPLKVAGQATFAAEFVPEGMVYAHFVHSTIAKGRIVSLDTSAAEGAPGVVLVMSHINAPELAVVPAFGTAPDGLAADDYPIMQDDRVYWNGMPVAVVLAETHEEAQHAASLIEVEYQADADAVTSFEAARAAGLHPASFAGQKLDISIGDAEAMLADATVSVDYVYRTPRHSHNAIEPHAVTVAWLDDGTLRVHDASQGVTAAAGALVKALGLEAGQVHLTSPYVGGGFGSKCFWQYHVIAAAAARLAGRPVRAALSREAVFRQVGGRTCTEQRVALGADAQGRFKALVHTGVVAMTDHNNIPEMFIRPSVCLYRADSFRLLVETANMDMGANFFMRAPGEAPGSFALESAVDELAEKLGIDPIALRLVNEPETDPIKGRPFSSRHLTKCWRDGAVAFGWDARDAMPGNRREGDWLIGMGVATATYPYNRFPGAAARLTLSADGTAIVATAAAEMGMGTATAHAQVAAERLGLPVEAVTVEYGDSTLPGVILAGGSQQTGAIGGAIIAAHRELVGELVRLAGNASPLAGLSVDEVATVPGGLCPKDAPGSIDTYADILARAGHDSVEVTAQAADPGENQQWAMHSWGAVFAEVRVNAVTGETRVSRLLGSYDAGRILNAKTAASQLRGGMIMGLGMALMEETLFDERKGRIMGASLADYHVPVHLDVPEITILTTDIPDPRAPAGARGLGEIGITGVAAAVANAVYNATGKRVRDLPITLDKLL